MPRVLVAQRIDQSFSALQRAENSSIRVLDELVGKERSFSALQRAENSSMSAQSDAHTVDRMVSVLFSEPKIPQSSVTTPTSSLFIEFQCSSASRKFLNDTRTALRLAGVKFQCSSASRKFLNGGGEVLSARAVGVSVLFSEPKIPQSSSSAVNASRTAVSVLFSEPKIPQLAEATWISRIEVEFQCSSASRKFLNLEGVNGAAAMFWRFSALQRAENSSISQKTRRCWRCSDVSVLFSEPKIPQSSTPSCRAPNAQRFQCSSASRKFLNGCINRHVGTRS